MNRIKTTQVELKKLLEYNPGTGEFKWLKNRGGKALAGSIAGKQNEKGYVVICLCGQMVRAHRLVWLYVHGSMPEEEMQVDHINGIKYDNRFENLRLATASENRFNCGKKRNNSSGFKGVSIMKGVGKWQAQISYCRTHKHLGFFNSKEDAYAAYCSAAIEKHGKFVKTI